ncbi:hypothetical protein LTR56_012591 [Elasticomyces elasticus]|nr:hypothetical protein LTR22_018466 [Elasticomyces elasticus]KAK3639231.1 hypothetical protein LTR56_012591 [Elasticomyces elasticus]KAK4912535.1 hypothetical protein LTR49_019002 [Elasticomyces elasticus]
MATSTPGMLRLPTELQAEITSYLTSKEDLKALCYTCKELCYIATQPLYETLELPAAALDSTLRDQLHAKNPGMRFIRDISIYDSRTFGGYDHIDHGAALCDLIRALPRDSLVHFRLETVEDVKLEVALLLQTRQRKLKNHQLHHMSTAPTANISPDADDFKHVSNVQLYIGSRNDCARANLLLQNIPGVNSLEISVSSEIEKAWRKSADMWAMRRVLGIDAAHPRGNINIRPRRLRLKQLKLERAARDLADVIDLGHVEHWALEKCHATHALFAELREHRPSLKSIATIRLREEENNPAAYNLLLWCAKGLEVVKLSAGDSTATDSCDYAAIGRHGQTLHTLYVDDMFDEAEVFSNEFHDRSFADFKEMCKACRKLQQLAVWAPLAHHEWWFDKEGFLDMLGCLAHLSKLRTLRLFIHIEGKNYIGKDIHLLTLKVNVQMMADRVFKELSVSCPELIGLVIDARDKYNDPTRKPFKRFGYLRGTQTDACGRAEAVGVPIEPHMIKHHEPCAEILEDDARMAREY